MFLDFNVSAKTSRSNTNFKIKPKKYTYKLNYFKFSFLYRDITD